jgi:DNA-binding transcriptional LysR family regulator
MANGAMASHLAATLAAMDLQQLRSFLEVVRLGSFAAAARALDVAPSAVTRAVAALEEELGARLLNRTTRQVSLTEAGARYVERARPVLQELDEAGEDLREQTGELRGTVRVTASVGYGQAVLMPLMPALHRAHPGLQIDLLLTDAVVDMVAQRIDVALRLGPSVDSSFIGMRLRPVHYRVVASPAYLAAHGRPRVPADLVDCACLRFPLPGFRSEWRFRAHGATGDATVESVSVGGWLVASGSSALRRGALEGLGPAMLPDWLVDTDVAQGELVDLFPGVEASASAFDSALWLLYPAREHLPRRVRAFVDFARSALGR